MSGYRFSANYVTMNTTQFRIVKRLLEAAESVGANELVVCNDPLVGNIVKNDPFAIPGEYVEVEGRWVVDRNHGQQFKADSIRTTHPGSPEGMERYLGSGFVKGIGPHFVTKLVEVFGDKVFEIIEKQSERLTDVRGIKAVAFAINRAVVRRRYCGLNRRLAAVAPWL